MNAQAKGLSIITLWRAAFNCTPKGLTRFAGASRGISQVTGQGGKKFLRELHVLCRAQKNNPTFRTP